MSHHHSLLKRITQLAMILMMGVSMNTNAGFLGFGGDSWKEEVQLHDGSKLIVKRSQSYGGRHEIGQGAPIKEYNLSFTLPNSNKTIKWISEYSDDVGRANLHPLALHLLNDTPYIVAEPNLCLAYNKWGRPNPPYVLFKYSGKDWQRITIQELPAEFKNINLVNNTKSHAEHLMEASVVTAEAIKQFNSSLTQPEYKIILREALPTAPSGCPDMVSDGNGGWIGRDWFTDQPSLGACLKYCESRKIGTQYCLCNSIFKGK